MVGGQKDEYDGQFKALGEDHCTNCCLRVGGFIIDFGMTKCMCRAWGGILDNEKTRNVKLRGKRGPPSPGTGPGGR